MFGKVKGVIKIDLVINYIDEFMGGFENFYFSCVFYSISVWSFYLCFLLINIGCEIE